eukprot:SAG25_NODE_733_length_5663_cov_27.142523_9_plen_173_part_00
MEIPDSMPARPIDCYCTRTTGHRQHRGASRHAATIQPAGRLAGLLLAIDLARPRLGTPSMMAEEGQAATDSSSSANDGPSATTSRSAVLEDVSRNGWRLAVAPAALRADREVVMAAVASHGEALYHAATELRADRELVMTAVAQDGNALAHAATELKNDDQVVALAMGQVRR